MVWKGIWKREGFNWKFAWRGFLVIWQLSIKRWVESQKHFFSIFSSLPPLSPENFFHSSPLSRDSPPPSDYRRTVATSPPSCCRRPVIPSVSSLPSDHLIFSSLLVDLSCDCWWWFGVFGIKLIWVLFRSGKWLDCC